MESNRDLNLQGGYDKGKSLNRRKFLLYSAGVSAGLVGIATARKQIARFFQTSPHQDISHLGTVPNSSRVVIARSNTLFGTDQNPQRGQIDQILENGMRSLFDAGDSMQAWRELFKPDDVVGIKVNCIAGRNLSSHPSVVAAIVSQLEKIPIPKEKIIIWDRKNKELAAAGYIINSDKPNVRCYGTDTVGYEEKANRVRSFNGCLSKILTRQITALINVPILKHHSGAGVTIAMKNHYGSIHNPGSQHGNMCDPHIADLNSLDEIRGKTRLIVCDATRATCNAGPGYNPAFAWQYSGLIVSCDPVAVDTIGTKIIEERRKEVGLPTLAEAGRYPRQLTSAAERGLGNTGMNKINLVALTV